MLRSETTSPSDNVRLPTRRSFFAHVAGGIYGAALTSLLERDLRADDLKPRKPHFEAKAKSVIHLFL